MSALLRNAGSSPARESQRGARRWSPSWWAEWHREMRRHAGDGRLPPALRERLRESARQALVRSAAAASPPRFPRRRLREPMAMPFSPAQLAEAAASVAAADVPRDRPVVAIESGRRPDRLADAVSWLLHRGYCIVRVGASAERMKQPGIIDLTAPPRRITLMDLAVLQASRFVVCEALDFQHLAYVTGTPSLLLNARDPFSGYPVRGNAVFTLATAIDLDNGQALAPVDMLAESYLRNRRNYGYRGNRADEIVAAVEEVHEAVARGFDDAGSQARFREAVETAGTAMAADVPFVAEWGPDAGFIGDGRLARWQAERVSPSP